MTLNSTLKLIDRLEASTLSNNVKLEYDHMIIKDYYWRDEEYPELVITRSNVVSISGPSGSGKSTFIRNILGLTQHTSGCIVLSGKSSGIAIPNLNRYWHSISCYCESRVFVEGTILENIVGANTSVSFPVKDFRMCDSADNSVQNRLALIAAHLGVSFGDDDGATFSLLTKIDKYGSNLSAGQKQRLCLARALFKEADLFIFDEPTSKLDTNSENNFFRLLKKLNATALVVTHSSNLISQCDANLSFNV